MSHDDLLAIIEDAPTSSDSNEPVWRILVVDDDPEVHESTSFALRGVKLLERSLHLTYAHSANHAMALLTGDDSFAVILLDVVMESYDSGLQLVRRIRDELQQHDIRIILRTGQPGYAPELEVFTHYDINDYRTKAELTRTRLLTSLCAALRTYEQIHTIAEGRRGLQLIINATADLIQRHALNAFAEGVLTQITALLHLPLEGVVCVQRGSPFDTNDAHGLFVVGAAGQLSNCFAKPLDEIADSHVREAILKCINQREHLLERSHSCLYLHSGHQEAAVYLASPAQLRPLDRQLLEVFSANLSVCFGNVRLIEQLEYTAYHDLLTGLLNRSGFLQQIAQHSPQPAQCIALLDIAHFTDLNDGLGHDFGNKVLCQLAERLRQALPDTVQLARLSADLFAMVGPRELLNPTHLNTLLETPLQVEDMRLPLQAALGLCDLLEQTENPLTLLQRANIALNRAKKSLQVQHEYFIPEMENNTRWRLEVIHQLRTDFEAGRLEVWYQPQINLATGQPSGVEALMRWPGNNGFIQPPSVFVPLAEYSGLILDLGNWVLDEACRALQEIVALPCTVQRMAVNVSMPQLRQTNFVENLAAILRRHAVNPANLELEITESIAMDEPKVVRRGLDAIKGLGVRIAVDDFGTGYSSLSHLRDLPIDCLKIDRCFISEIHGGQGGMFAETIAAFARKLGLSTVAEGVETPEQAGFLRALGCTEAQGFLYAKPMPLHELLTFLGNRPSA
jgi:c-di-GMP phosphodiesterase